MLPRGKSNRICVASISYRYIVSEAADSNEDGVALTVNVQSEDHNGAILRVTGLTTLRVPEEESKFYMGRTVSRSMQPRHVADLIALARKRGWTPHEPGVPFVLSAENDQVFGPDR